MFIADAADKASDCRANGTSKFCDVRHSAGFASFFSRGLALTALRGGPQIWLKFHPAPGRT
jgi:hypothetical protein